MIWELGVDPELPEEAIEQTRAIQETRRELSRTQLLDVRARALQLQCHPDNGESTIGIAVAFVAFLDRDSKMLAEKGENLHFDKGYDA